MPCRKCQGITAKGTACTRYASCRIGCKYFCWQHADNYVKRQGCPKKKKSPKKSSRKKSSKKSSGKKSPKQKGILKPPRSKSKTKKKVRFKPKSSLTKVYPIPARPKKKAPVKKKAPIKKKAPVKKK